LTADAERQIREAERERAAQALQEQIRTWKQRAASAARDQTMDRELGR
jgi:hypothetical protein